MLKNKKRGFFKFKLLTGPSGTGKTTLAHILAEHCGYQKVCINASDNKTLKKLKQNCENAINYQSLYNNSRPNLLILDEIDSFFGGNSIVNLILNLTRKCKKNNLKIKKLPIICICNDLFAKVLKPLKSHCLIFRFKPFHILKLIDRLKTICEKEKMNVEFNALKYLATITNCDVRSCLNTLSFLKDNSNTKVKYKKLTKNMIKNFLIGQKKIIHNLFDIWNFLLKNKCLHEFYRKVNSQHIIQELIQNKSQELLLNGLEENIFDFLYNDNHFQNTIEATKWLSFSDLLMNKIHKKQAYHFYGFSSYVMLALKNICTFISTKYVHFPRNYIDSKRIESKNKNIVDNFLKHHQQNNVFEHNFNSVVLDVIPCLMHILRPRLKIEDGLSLLSGQGRYNIPTIHVSQNEKNPLSEFKHPNSFGFLSNNVFKLIQDEIISEKNLSNKKVINKINLKCTKTLVLPNTYTTIKCEKRFRKNNERNVKIEDWL